MSDPLIPSPNRLPNLEIRVVEMKNGYVVAVQPRQDFHDGFIPDGFVASSKDDASKIIIDEIRKHLNIWTGSGV